MAYCVICDGYGGTHAPCPKCGQYHKTGIILGGISPGFREDESTTKNDTRLAFDVLVTSTTMTPMPSPSDWVKQQTVCDNAICENQVMYGKKCPLEFSCNRYPSVGISIYKCHLCKCQFLVSELRKVVIVNKGMKEDKP